MDLAGEIDFYIKETIDHYLGLPISIHVLQKKLNTVKESHHRLHEQNQSLLSRLKEKDQVINLVRSEASLNALALKKFVKKNQNLVTDCTDLVNQCKKLENECVLYHQDREAVMEFGNESDQRAREAESKVLELEQEIQKLKNQIESEDLLLDSVLNQWDELKPSSSKIVSLVSMVKKSEKEKECLTLNLVKAEEEVELVSIQNKELILRENRKLLKQFRSPNCSSKRKSPKKMTSLSKKKIDFNSPGSIKYC